MNNSPVGPQANPSKWMWVVLTVVVVLVFGGIAAWYFLTNKPASTQTATTTSPAQTQPTAITNDSDLQAASKELDNTDIDSLDTTLSQNDADASEF